MRIEYIYVVYDAQTNEFLYATTRYSDALGYKVNSPVPYVRIEHFSIAELLSKAGLSQAKNPLDRNKMFPNIFRPK